MCNDLLPDIVDTFDEGERFVCMGRNGRGIQMGVWAGGRLEPRSLPTMGGNFCTPMGVIDSFGTLWVDIEGRRYCNENFGDPVFAGFPGAQLKRDSVTRVFDANIFNHLQSGPPSHGSFFINNEVDEKRLRDSMDGARAAGAEGYPTAGGTRLYAADSFEELADRLGFEGTARQNFLESIERYNQLCAAGRDDDFGKDPSQLHALVKPPYYGQPARISTSVGFFLVTVGGLLTDEKQNVLDQRREPIPGLYATGNCCGRRFGLQYSTPIAGVSIGIALTLGREVGRIVAGL
jgi:hypothetical protein